ncbi:MAG: PilZ domain-containing protein [Proteobacteria bacterium]|nr:PilZ domain-containing protein [Pseudomonadota bacterium]
MRIREAKPWNVFSSVEPRAFEPGARAALLQLGYRLVPAVAGFREEAPDLRVVDTRHLGRVPKVEREPETPIVLLTGARPPSQEDPRIVGWTTRPAGLKSLYRLFQKALSMNRRVPRVATHLAARGVRADRRFTGSVLELSEGGCLFRPGEHLPANLCLNLELSLPGGRSLSLRASEQYRHLDRIGLRFLETPGESQRALAEFVSQRLACLPAVSPAPGGPG